jgi:hypothetical protein
MPDIELDYPAMTFFPLARFLQRLLDECCARDFAGK